MDDDIDDLFGDAAPLHIPVPLSSALVSYLNERSLCGCRQKIAWSKSGAIAYVTADVKGVIIQHLLCDPQNGQWRLSRQYSIENIAAVSGDVDLVHLSWDQTGSLLAVCDAYGRIFIWSVHIAINRMRVVRRCTSDSANDLSAPVGLTWLQQDRSQTFFFRPTTRKDGQWSYIMSPQGIHGPKHPQQKPSMLAVTRARYVMVIHQDKENRWVVVRAELDPLTHSSKLLTHAAFCVDRTDNSDGMLLATYDIAGELGVYGLRIDFEASRINVRRLAGLASCSSYMKHNEDFLRTHEAPSKAFLIHLDFLPTIPESKGKTSTQPVVLTTFSRISHDFQGADHVETDICAWTLTSSRLALHSTLSRLSSNKPTQNPTNNAFHDYRLVHSAKLSTAKILLFSQYINMHTVTAFAWSDGSIEFRDSHSLDIVSQDEGDQISGLSHINFAFLPNRPCVQVALSPNSCAAFSVDEARFSAVTFLQYVDPNAHTTSLDESRLEIISEAFAVQLSIASRTSNTNDLLATIQLFTNQYLSQQLQLDFSTSLTNSLNFNRTLTSEIYRNLGVKLDTTLADQPDQIRNIFFQRSLGLQAALGFQGALTLRPLEGMVAMLVLQLRYFVTVWAYVFSRKNGQSHQELKKPEAASFLLPLANWFLTLICFITDELVSMRNAFEDSGVMPNHIDANIINQNIRQMHSPALILLYSSTSRAVLKQSICLMAALATECEKHQDTSVSGRIFREFDLLLRKPVVTILQFDRILVHIDSSSKCAYQAPGFSDNNRRMTEEQLLIRAEIPPNLVPSVTQLLFQTLSSLKKEINEAELYFMDASSLGLTSDNHTRDKIQQEPLDVITKTTLHREHGVRRCPRCCSFTGDLTGPKLSNIITAFLARQCICGDSWMMLDREELMERHA